MLTTVLVCLQPEEYHPLRDFCAVTSSTHKIPSWFPNKEYYHMDEDIEEGVIKVDINPCLRHSEWSGIVACFLISGYGSVEIAWSSTAPEDNDNRSNKWAHSFSFGKDYKLFTMVLELNEKTCWQHLTPPNNCLRFNFFIHKSEYDIAKIRGSGWRLICKEAVKDWCNIYDLSQLTLPQFASPREVNISKRVFDRFIKKVPNHSTIPFYHENVLDAWL